MFTDHVGYAEGNFSEDTTRGISPNIWKGFDLVKLRFGFGGWADFDDFTNGPVVAAAAEAQYGDYKGFASTGGTAAATAARGGVLTFSSDGDDEGASLAQRNTAYQIDLGLGAFAFEARFKTSTIADTKHGIFVGMLDAATLSATVPIAAAGTLADENFVGFHRLEGDGDKLDTVYKADGVTQVTVKEDAITLVADTYVKVGMVFDPSTKLLTFYKNGTPLADTKAIPTADGTDFPNDVTLGFVFAVLNATATTPGSSALDWFCVAQKQID